MILVTSSPLLEHESSAKSPKPLTLAFPTPKPWKESNSGEPLGKTLGEGVGIELSEYKNVMNILKTNIKIIKIAP